MHILFLTDNFPPEVNAPATRTFEHCREWVRAGHRVTVVTGAPNFPAGKVFPGYRNRLFQREEMSGIEVVRVWTYITANEGFAKRIADYASFMLMAILAAPFVRGVDLVIGTSPQLFTTCAAYVASRMKRAPFVFELRDLWPESIRAVGAMRNERLFRLLERLELFLYRKAALIVSVTHAFRDDLERRGIDAGKIRVVTNGVDLSRFEPRPKDEQLIERYGLRDSFVVGYIGTHGMAHGLDTLLDAAALLRQRGEAPAVRFLFLGGGARRAALLARAQALGLDNVVFIETVERAEVPRYWSLLDASIIHLRRTPLFHSVIPSKLFECMAMGIPVLHGVEGESAGIVTREDVGLTFVLEDAADLCRRLEELREDRAAFQRLRRNGPLAARRYERTHLARQMLALLSGLPKRTT